MIKNDEKVFWFANSKSKKEYATSAWYPCVGIQYFLNKMEKQGKRPVAFIANNNNIRFVLEEEVNDERKRN